ncbi:MAG: DUF4007 family protein [Mesorhizobium sp.]|uniref:DUF4007 family protein n=1 Tax=Mesorhizobium sp. TaxID=1871066 RepID=UPI000FE41312|nr:DUF4007 family protein [Mesorhizobium sp.]RWJ04461.1 MAG: DUF4007 family protein [Mesorhizobium sp.]RWJ15224.1 MAG: DUF4007 family protein [Mesorhizobium sp.]
MFDVSVAEGQPSYRFSGHETFACRYAWLPKAYRAIDADPAIFFNEDAAMVELGIGKNMVRSLRFWVDAMGIARPAADRTHIITEMGHAIFGVDGCDPFLEESKTLWLLHWNLSSAAAPGLFAWHYLLGVWPYAEFSRSEALAAFLRQSQRLGHAHSSVTLSQHLDIFIHTYQSARSARVGIEDSLDGPLVELRLLQQTGERRGDSGRWEPVYAFRREPKSEISNDLFGYAILDYWDRIASAEKTMLVRNILSAPGSPGQAFKLPEDDVRARLEAISRNGTFGFTYRPSAIQGLLTRDTAVRPNPRAIYTNEAIIHG